LQTLYRELEQYFAGHLTTFTVPLSPVGTPFEQKAWAYLRTIPHGQTRSYGQQAHAIGNSRAARAVGGANGRNPIAVVVPCHRVIGSTGSLTGFASGLDRKRWLLEHERKIAGAYDLFQIG
jgi:methylated-DNA-[protein]-cysteine S-methyltransferase